VCRTCGTPLCAECAQPASAHRLACAKSLNPFSGGTRRRAGITIVAAVNFLAVILTLIMAVSVFDDIEVRWLAPVYLAGGLAVSALGVASGVGLLKRREWARKGAIIFAVLSFLLARLLVTEFNLCAREPVFDRAAEFPKALMDGIILHVFAVLWRVPYIIYLTRPMVKAQFGHQVKGRTPASAMPPK
jgi:hypothetical protein